MPRLARSSGQPISLRRCQWPGNDPLMVRYHDEEWGVPVHNDRLLFEYLTLEGAQAGLTWRTVLHRRDAYRKAFAKFDPAKIARFTQADEQRLLNDAGIIRNRLKIAATVTNAQGVLALQEEFGTLDRYVWGFTDGKTLRTPGLRSLADVPAKTTQSEAMSKDLQKRGFRFVGSTICYAFMQATGLVNDHVIGCFRAREI